MIDDLHYLGLNRKFDDPFLLPSGVSMPRELVSALDWARFLYMMNPQYRQASSRVCRHFITDFDFSDNEGDKKEHDRLDTLLKQTLELKIIMAEAGDEWACLAGETPVVTRNGVYPIRELAGQRVDVLSKDGVYRPADFKSYGVQKLLEVEFSDGRKIYATPEHQWEVKNCSGKLVRIPTTDLHEGHRIARTVAPRPIQDDTFREGVRHGFIFGDGEKDQALYPYFDGEGNARLPRLDRKETWRQSGFPKHYKQLPATDAAPSYWYGFVVGFLAANGSCDTHGCAILSQASRETLDTIVRQLPRIGMAAGPVRPQIRDTEIGGREYKDHTMYTVTLLKRFMRPEDFIIPAHRTKFEARKCDTRYGKFVAVKAIRETGRQEEVFCCTEMATHTFVVDNGVLTGNCYGNAFYRIHFPFDRFLYDPKGGVEYSMDMFNQAETKFDLTTMTYEVPDPKNPKRRRKFPFRDFKSTDESRIKLRKMDPRHMVIRHHIVSGATDYIWRFDPQTISDVKKGNIFIVNDLPLDMLKAIRDESDFLFGRDQVFHFKAPTISGVSNKGWGLPNTIANYRSLYQLQVYRKIDEAIGLDYMVPFRLFTPNFGDKLNDVFNNLLLGTWTEEVGHIIDARRRDKFSMHALPFPVNYQEFGGEGKEYVPKDLIEYQTNAMLDGMGYPAELFKGSLEYMQVPTAMRLFEQTFEFIYFNFDKMLKWTAKRVQAYLGRPNILPNMQQPSLADSLERKQILLQLAAAGEISRETAYDIFGISDPVAEAQKRMTEDLGIEKKKMKLQRDFQREMETGEAMSGEAGAQQQQQSGLTPLDINAQADELAQSWLQIPSDGQRSQAMQAVRGANPQLYALAKQKMEEMRRSGESAGRQQVNAGNPPPGQEQ